MSEETCITSDPQPEDTRFSPERESKKAECEQKVLRNAWPWYRVLLHILVAWLVGSLFLIFVMVGVAAQQKKALEANIRKIQVGDTKERVIQVLGQPDAQFAKGGRLFDLVRKKNFLLWLLLPESPETWVYGSWKILRLGREEDDYAIQFDDSGRVRTVDFPNPR